MLSSCLHGYFPFLALHQAHLRPRLLSSVQGYGRCKSLAMHISKHFSCYILCTESTLRKRRDAYSHQDDITASFRASNVYLFLVQWKVAASGFRKNVQLTQKNRCNPGALEESQTEPMTALQGWVITQFP